MKFYRAGFQQIINCRLKEHKKRSSSWVRLGAAFLKLSENKKCETFDQTKITYNFSSKSSDFEGLKVLDIYDFFRLAFFDTTSSYRGQSFDPAELQL